MVSLSEGLSAAELEDLDYGIRVIRNSVLVGGTVFAAGIFTGEVLSTLFFIILMGNLRTVSGGFHMSKLWRCWIVTTLLSLLSSFGGLWLHDAIGWLTLIPMGLLSSWLLLCYGDGSVKVSDDSVKVNDDIRDNRSGSCEQSKSLSERRNRCLKSFRISVLWHLVVLIGMVLFDGPPQCYSIEITMLIIALCTVRSEKFYLLNPMKL